MSIPKDDDDDTESKPDSIQAEIAELRAAIVRLTETVEGKPTKADGS